MQKNKIIGAILVLLCIATAIYSLWITNKYTDYKAIFPEKFQSDALKDGATPEPAIVHVSLDSVGSKIVELAQADPRKAIEEMKIEMLSDEILRNNCHGVMHQIGVTAQQNHGFTGAMAYQDGVCGSGYIHGVIMGEFGIGHTSDIDVGTVCADTPTESCYHGIGHGLMVLTKNDVEKSLLECDQLPEIGQRDCYDGVFMHVYDNEENGVGELVDIPNFETLCSEVDQKYSVNCYFYMPRYFARKGGQNVIDKCREMRGLDAYMCSMGAGHTNMKYNIKTKESALNYCNAFNGDSRKACRDGAFKYYFFDRSTAGLVGQEANAEKLCFGFAGEDLSLCVRSHRKYFGII